MKKYLFIALLIQVMGVFAASPVYYWNFDHDVPGGSGTQKIKISKANIVEKTGINESSGLVCGPDHRNYIANFSGMNWKSFTLELKFKPARELSETKGGTLFSYAVNSYYRRQFTLSLDAGGKITAWFEIRDDKDTKKVLLHQKNTGEAVRFLPTQWYTIRVAASSGKEMKIWLDGRLYAVFDNALSFSDLDGVTPREYPFAGIGYNIYAAGAMNAPFHGVIDDLALWDSFEEPPLSHSSGKLSSKDPNLAVTDSEQLEWSTPFTVYDRETSVLGNFERVEEKFHAGAAQAALQLNRENLQVSFKCPIPAGTTPGNSDHVEFFLKPSEQENVYYQFVINANGTMKAWRYLGPNNPDHHWKSNAAVKAENSEKQFLLTLTIPLPELGLNPENLSAGSVLTGNFTRSGATAGGQSSWAPVGRNFHQPDRFGKFVIGKRDSYFQKRLSTLEKALEQYKSSDLKINTLKKLSELKKSIQEQGNDPFFWDSLSDALYNMEQNLLLMSLDGKPYLIWNAPVWNNDLTINALAAPIRKISLKAARNSKIFYGFCFSNLSDQPFMGQLKFITDNENLQRFNSMPQHELYRHLSLKVGITVKEYNGLPIYDPLMPLPLNTLIQANAKSSIPMWLEIKTGNLVPGIYKGYFYLKPSYRDFPPEEIEFELEVVDIDLNTVQTDNFNYSYLPPEMSHILVDYELNILYAGTPGQSTLDINPEVDAAGNILRHDFSALDRKIEAYQKAGMPLEKMKVILFLGAEFNWILKKQNSAPLKPWSEPWQKAFKGFLTGLNDHLQNRYGLGNERLILYPVDEPHGDALQDGTKMNMAYRFARFIKEVNPRIRTMVNPQLKENPQTLKNLEVLSEVFDIITLYRGRTTPETTKWAVNTKREIWTYHILQKTNTPETYRKLSWLNLRDRISSVSAYWHLDSMAGGDGFDSSDTFPKKTNSADYGTLYVDFNYETVLSSRRQEAWYQGFLDYKLATLCRQMIQEKPQAKNLESALDEIIGKALGGDIAVMEQMHRELLDLAMKLKSL